MGRNPFARNVSLAAVAALLLGAGAARSEAAEEPQSLFLCQLDRSFSLTILQQQSEGGMDLVLERKHFLGPQGHERLVIHDPWIVSNSHVFLAFQDQGKEGYFLLRAERGVKPSEADLGDASILIDNSLMGSIGTMFHTSGRLMMFPNCVSQP